MEHTTANNPEDPTPEPGNSPMGCVKGCGLGYLGLVLVAGVGSTFVGVSYGWSELWWSVEWLHIVRSPHYIPFPRVTVFHRFLGDIPRFVGCLLGGYRGYRSLDCCRVGCFVGIIYLGTCFTRQGV